MVSPGGENLLKRCWNCNWIQQYRPLSFTVLWSDRSLIWCGSIGNHGCSRRLLWHSVWEDCCVIQTWAKTCDWSGMIQRVFMIGCFFTLLSNLKAYMMCLEKVSKVSCHVLFTFFLPVSMLMQYVLILLWHISCSNVINVYVITLISPVPSWVNCVMVTGGGKLVWSQSLSLPCVSLLP